MSTNVTLGGKRLGSGGKMSVALNNFERSTHDLSHLWKSTLSPGTLVPFMSLVALPGDTFDIELFADIMTPPTKGPLFGDFKLQLDVFAVPVRLYQGKLHMNLLGVGMEMQNISLPQYFIDSNPPAMDKIDNYSINPSSIFSYLGVRGTGGKRTASRRFFNAVPFLAYWDIFKQYYANKQEDNAYVIHHFTGNQSWELHNEEYWPDKVTDPSNSIGIGITGVELNFSDNSELVLDYDVTGLGGFDIDRVTIEVSTVSSSAGFVKIPILGLFNKYNNITPSKTILTEISDLFRINGKVWAKNIEYSALPIQTPDSEPKLVSFPLENIDNMRKAILKTIDTDFIVNTELSYAPFDLPFQYFGTDRSITYSQEGLAVKTYQSDLFNNWLQTEWIDGTNGIANITAIDTSGGKFTIDELNLSRKVYDMLNRIAVSGGSYDDWLNSVYTHERRQGQEYPHYLGGMMQMLKFQEIVSTADSNSPLGSLAGRGRLSDNRKGGKIIAKIDEPSYLIGIVSLTPIITYSQGNQWDVNLKTMDDFHKPSLDQIGFQDLITDQLAFWDTITDDAANVDFYSAGKQPAWINYMTAVNVSKGNFAIENNQMWMTLNRRYEPSIDAPNNAYQIKDLTTYIDPVKFNYIFAEGRRDSMNFWTQIALNITARRKMSAKQIPNL